MIVPVSEPGLRGNCSASDGTSYPGAVVSSMQYGSYLEPLIPLGTFTLALVTTRKGHKDTKEEGGVRTHEATQIHVEAANKLFIALPLGITSAKTPTDNVSYV